MSGLAAGRWGTVSPFVRSQLHWPGEEGALRPGAREHPSGVGGAVKETPGPRQLSGPSVQPGQGSGPRWSQQ